MTDPKRNDIVLVRNSRRDSWCVAVFDGIESSFCRLGGEKPACIDGCGNRWTHWVPLQGHEELQDTSLPEDGWQSGDLCVWKDSEGHKTLGFYAGADENGFALVSREPINWMRPPVGFKVPMDALLRPEKEWFWWDGGVYKKYEDEVMPKPL